MADVKKMAFVFGDVTLTLTPDDIELVTTKLALRLGREPTSAEFADAMLAHMTDNAKLTRTVLHN